MSDRSKKGPEAPEKIEERSFAIINEELEAMGISLDLENGPVIRRAIHTTADFDYARNLVFSPGAVRRGIEALENGAVIVTDTNMAKAGINKKKAESLGVQVFCFMADEDVAEEARLRGCTRAVVSMEKSAGLFGNPAAEAVPEGEPFSEGGECRESTEGRVGRECREGRAGSERREGRAGEKSRENGKRPPVIYAVGNAPTALQALCRLMDEGKLTPALIVGAPVGFVNVVSSKVELIERQDVPYIVPRGRKGGSNVAAAIINAMLYQAGVPGKGGTQ